MLVLNKKGEWKSAGNHKSLRLTFGSDKLDIRIRSVPNLDRVEKVIVLNQLNIGLIPYTYVCVTEGKSMFKAGRIDVSELSGEDLKQVFSDLQERELSLTLLPTRNYVYREGENLHIKVIRELNVYLPSIQFPDDELIQQTGSSFQFPSHLTKGSCTANEYFYSYLIHELEFLAEASPLIRESQHDITPLSEGNDIKILKMLHKRGYPAKIEGPYVTSNIFGHCRVERSLIIELPDPPEV